MTDRVTLRQVEIPSCNSERILVNMLRVAETLVIGTHISWYTWVPRSWEECEKVVRRIEDKLSGNNRT